MAYVGDAPAAAAASSNLIVVRLDVLLGGRQVWFDAFE